MRRVQTALPAGQPPGPGVHRWRSPGWAGDLNGVAARRRRPRFRDRGGATSWRRPGLWLVADLSSSKRLRVRPAFSNTESTANRESFREAAPMSSCAATGGRRREKAGWMTSNDKRCSPAGQLDIVRTCGSPQGFPRPGQKRRRRSCRSVGLVNRTWAAFPQAPLSLSRPAFPGFRLQNDYCSLRTVLTLKMS